MKSLSIIMLLCISMGALFAQVPDVKILEGEWKVDLRPTPDAEPYYQMLEIREVGDGNFKGIFYGTEMTSTNVNVDWGSLVIAFITEDGSGFYCSTAKYEDGILKGTTHSTGRDFLSLWTAEKVLD